ncbi:MAG: hypothetical protein HZB51_16620 [Chloroflexi bacterium]|nr:hypothetical protein [Chloroflexota bacterium]
MSKALTVNKYMLFSTILIIILGLMTTACTATSSAATNSAINPIIVMNAPLNNAQFKEGDLVTVQSIATDLAGIVRVELSVDNNIVRTDPLQQSQTTAIMVQTWIATPGMHTITVRAVNKADISSAPASIAISVAPVIAATPTPRVITVTPIPQVQAVTVTPVSSLTCVNNSAFVADVTIPDRTVIAAGQTFNKVWRVRNTGTCTWGTDEELIFVRGEAMTKTATIAIPVTAPGATADLAIAMTAPVAPGTHTGDWRMRNRVGAIFGTTLSVSINVPGPTPINTAVSCPFTPAIESFTITPTTITAGQSATLNWGAVIGAEMAEIDNGIGGVSTPGSIAVSPATTTTYTLTATCGDKSRTAQVTINVNPAAPVGTATATTAPTNTPTRTPTVTPKP